MSTPEVITLGQPGLVSFRKAIVDLPGTASYELFFQPSGEAQLKIREPVDGDSNILPSRFETGEGKPITHISLKEFQELSRKERMRLFRNPRSPGVPRTRPSR